MGFACRHISDVSPVGFEVVGFASAWHARFGPFTCFAPENWDLPASAGAHGHDGNVGRSSHKRLQGQNPHELLGGSLSLLVLVCFAVSVCQITFAMSKQGVAAVGFGDFHSLQQKPIWIYLEGPTWYKSGCLFFIFLPPTGCRRSQATSGQRAPRKDRGCRTHRHSRALE